MADELQYYGDPASDTGLTVIARVYDATGTQVGSDASCSEVGALAIYQGDMPAASAGSYGVRFFNGTTLLGQGAIDWDGSAEVTNQTLDVEIETKSSQTSVDNLNDFDPASDVVARVTLVDTTTANTDMRGTDGANTVVPDNAGIAAILVDTNELQTNQGDWATATGFATPANITSAQTAIQADITNLNDFDPATEIVASNITEVNGTSVTSISEFTDEMTASEMQSALNSYIIEGATTFPESMRLINSVLLGKVSGAGTGTEVFRDVGDTKDRVTSSVDSSGNRTTVVLDGS